MKREEDLGVTIVRPECDHLDASNREEFRADLERQTGNAKMVVLDLSPVRFVDSSGLGIIMNSLKRLRASGAEMVACGINKPVKVLFDLVRLDRVLQVFDDRTQAVDFYKGGGAPRDGQTR